MQSLVSAKDVEIEQLRENLSLVSAKDAEIEQLRAEIERLRACMPTTADAVPTPCTSVETFVSNYNTTTVDNLANAHSSQSMPTLTSTAGHVTSQYLDIEQLIKARILSAWTAAGFHK